MAVFSGSDLKRWRTAQGITAAELASSISCDDTTIYRYENGKLIPNPDAMFQICEVLGDVDRWTTWMRTEFPKSYGRMHPETPSYSMSCALIGMYAAIDFLIKNQREIWKEGAEDRISDKDLAEQVHKEVTVLIQTAQRVKSLLDCSFQKYQKEG